MCRLRTVRFYAPCLQRGHHEDHLGICALKHDRESLPKGESNGHNLPASAANFVAVLVQFLDRKQFLDEVVSLCAPPTERGEVYSMVK